MNIIASDNSEIVRSKLLEIDKCEFGSEPGAFGTTFSISTNDHIKPLIIRAISEAILENYELSLLRKAINASYGYFTKTERAQILKMAHRYIDDTPRKDRQKTIEGKLFEYFESNDEIMLDGFVNFRLKEYQDQLDAITDRAVDDFLVDREYKEFIKLLKYFVDIQQPKIDVIHIIPRESSQYAMYDVNRKDITDDCCREFINGVQNYSINYDDLLISALITLSPKKIYFHNIDKVTNHELIITIKNVFTKKVVECSGCQLCTQ